MYGAALYLYSRPGFFFKEICLLSFLRLSVELMLEISAFGNLEREEIMMSHKGREKIFVFATERQRTKIPSGDAIVSEAHSLSLLSIWKSEQSFSFFLSFSAAVYLGVLAIRMAGGNFTSLWFPFFLLPSFLLLAVPIFPLRCIFFPRETKTSIGIRDTEEKVPFPCSYLKRSIRDTMKPVQLI